MESGAKGHSQEVGRGDRPAERPRANVYMYHLYTPARKNWAVAPGNPVETDTRRQQPSYIKQATTSVETMDYSLTPFGGSAGSHMYSTDTPRRNRRLEPIQEERTDPATRGVLGRLSEMVIGKPNHTSVAIEGDENTLIGGDSSITSQSNCNNRGRNSLSFTLDFNPSHCQVGTFITLNNHHNKQTMMTKDEHTEEIELNQIKLERSEERKPPGDLVGPKTELADTPFETPAPTSPLRPIKAEDHYLRRQLSQSHRAISEDISLLMAEGDKLWKSLKCCTTIIVIILTAILLLVILRWVLYK